ncbi:cupin domain-containing protein [Paracidovorax avenae]|nr:cupin domain-containing protein [Paracidovorax avenae]AVS76949.1 cupin domain-containing protein [Paracidovorax avenae]AVS97891.1 cupin domain-containing protein [Paracidovorax avenae]AVT04900.1 cupin domain-containing protein [Paracidovorax avenae]AVT19107.1 cupin domain-containing protein [Paracidovorax avenae]
MAFVLRAVCRVPAIASLCVLSLFHAGSGWAREPIPLLLQANEGEQLTRRWGYPMTIKVDPVTAGARDFSAGTEDIAPGKKIPLHRHPHMEELVIVQSGTLLAHVGDQHRVVGPGGMAYAPAGTWMGFENTGNTTATVIWIFPRPGFEEYVRATSVPAGAAVTPLAGDELAAIRQRYRGHIELGGGDLAAYPTEALPSAIAISERSRP